MSRPKIELNRDKFLLSLHFDAVLYIEALSSKSKSK